MVSFCRQDSGCVADPTYLDRYCTACDAVFDDVYVFAQPPEDFQKPASRRAVYGSGLVRILLCIFHLS